jgi:DNA-binding CsgD family transcriptional regulator
MARIEVVRESGYGLLLSDIPEHIFFTWKGQFQESLNRNSLPRPIKLSALQQLFIKIVTEEWSQWSLFLGKSCLLLLTDEKGALLSVLGSESLQAELGQFGIPGTSFVMQHMGINGVSMAIQTGKPSVVVGKEHSVEAFSHWTCVCQPAIVKGKIVGYMDLSLYAEEDYVWALTVLGKVAFDVVRKIEVQTPPVTKEIVAWRMTELGFTPRELEVSVRWLNNQGILGIASDLRLSEGTVRNYIKSAYRKAGVGDKGRFIRLFLSNDANLF